MKAFFVAYGTLWLVVIVAFVSGRSWAWGAMIAFALGSIWYLTVGTILSAVLTALLLLPAVKELYRA